VRRRPLTSARAGFTMIEVMVSMLVMAIALIGLLALYKASTTAAGGSRRATEASVLAQDQLEQLRTSRTLGTDSVAGLDASGRVVADGAFTRSWRAVASVGFDELAVTVAWSEAGRPAQVVVRSRRIR